MNTIVRVIGKNGFGMYRSEVGEYFTRLMYSDYTHPAPRLDYLLRVNARHLFKEFENAFFEEFRYEWTGTDFIFGFKDYAQFRAWMNNADVLAELSLLGHKVIIMQGECFYGSTQAVIREETAKIIRCLTLEEYLSENGEPNLI